MEIKKILAITLALSLSCGMISSCGKTDKSASGSNGKVKISVGNWPDDTKPTEKARMDALLKSFTEKNPDIELVPDTYAYDTKTYTMKASANQLPTMYPTWFTEIDNIISSGYAADITSEMEQAGFTKAMNPDLIKLVTKDSKVYGIPTDAYAQGLYIDKKIFKEAGLVNSDGSIKVPDTYQDIADFSKIIKEKTGKAGLILPTTNNCGGWHFLNIAWANGVKFMEKDSGGKWKATFNTAEAKKALQYVKDLKWKYNAFPDNTVIDQEELNKTFGTYQGAMMFAPPPSGSLSSKYGMDIKDIMVVRMPQGDAGRYAQMGGNLWMFSKTATPEQINACIKWLKFTGFSNDLLTDEQVQTKKDEYKQKIEKKDIILDQNAFQVWNDEKKLQQEKDIAKDYTNVDTKDYEQYYKFEGVTIKPEEPACCQQLYAILDGCIQEVITNKDADIDKLIETANNDFQTNHLDKLS